MFQTSLTHVFLIRDVLDHNKDGSVLMRLESDGPATTTSPYISAREFDKCVSFVFLSNHGLGFILGHSFSRSMLRMIS